MNVRLEDYRPIVGSGVINELLLLAKLVRHRRLQYINSTSTGGGVAKILTRTVPLLRNLGIDATWDVIKGDQTFYGVTKAFHNALHGGKEVITEEMLEVFRSTTATNLSSLDIYGDIVVAHDPQPVGLIAKKQELLGAGCGAVTLTPPLQISMCGSSCTATSSTTMHSSFPCQASPNN